VAIVDPFKRPEQSAAAPAAAMPKITRPRINDPFANAAPAAITRPKTPAEAPGFGESFSRGLRRSLPETKSLLYGATAAAAGAVGADGVRDWGLENYQRVQRDEVAPLQNETSFADVASGKGGAGSWAGDTLGNFAGQALQSGAAALAGGAVGTAGGPGGSVAGAVGGVLARGVVKKAVEGQVAKMIARPLAQGVTKEAAEAAARQAVLRRLGGATIGGTGLNVAQETGIGFTGRAEDAAAAGEQLTPGDAARAIAFGVPAGLVDTAAEGLVAGRLMRGVSSNPSLLRRVGAGAVIGAGTEGATEGVQAVLERAGAARALTGEEATADYIENIAAGALGGGVAGAPSGLRRVERPVPEQQQEAPALVRRPIANLPAPVVEVDAQGEASTPQQRWDREQQLLGQGMQLRDSGQTADVRQARQQHPGFTPAPARPQPFPVAAPGSVMDAANALPTGRTFDGATGQLISSAPPVQRGTSGEPTPFAATPIVPPWIDQTTGEVRPATPDLVKEAVRQQLLAQHAQDGRLRMSSPQVAKAWAVSEKLVKSAKVALLQESNAARRLGMPDPLDTTRQPEAEPAQSQLDLPPDAGQVAPAPQPSAGPISDAAALLPAATRPSATAASTASASPPAPAPTAQPAQGEPSAQPRPAQASVTPAVERVYDESPDVLDTDITPSYGTAYSNPKAAEIAANRAGGGAKAIPVDGGFVVRMPSTAPVEKADESDRTRAAAPADGVAPGSGSVAPAPAAADATGAPAASPAAAGSSAAATVAAPPSVASAPAALPEATEATLRGRLARQRTQAGEEMVTFRRRQGGTVLVRRADLDNAALPVLPLYNSAGAQLRTGIGSTVLRKDLANMAPLRGVPDAQQGWVSPAPAGITAPQGAQQESVDVAGQQQDQASTIDAQVTQPEPPVGDASSPAPGVPALGVSESYADDPVRWQQRSAKRASSKPARVVGSVGGAQIEYVPRDTRNPYDMPKFRAVEPDGSVVGELSVLVEGDSGVGAVEVSPTHRRKGVATGLYVAAERELGVTLKPEISHTAAAAALWAQPNRPFGNRTERRADSEQRAAINALPQDERDIEIQRLRSANAQLQEQLDTDPLTGVRSRAAYERDKASAGGVATIDLKLFKGYNTVGGQTGGDIVLRAFGAALRDIEGDARAYRPGGDEFALLGDSPEAVATAAARLESAAANIYTTLEKDGVRFVVNGVPFTAGIGTDEQSADADLSSRKGDYDRNALPESIRRADQDQLGAGRAADEGRGADNLGGVPPGEAVGGGLSDVAAADHGDPAGTEHRDPAGRVSAAAPARSDARADRPRAGNAGLDAVGESQVPGRDVEATGRNPDTGDARPAAEIPASRKPPNRLGAETEQTPETPAQAGVSASGSARRDIQTKRWENMIARYVKTGDEKVLPRLPSGESGAGLTAAEAWVINNQEQFVHTLSEMGRWPRVEAGRRYGDSEPGAPSQEQSEWIRKNWRKGIDLWMKSMSAAERRSIADSYDDSLEATLYKKRLATEYDRLGQGKLSDRVMSARTMDETTAALDADRADALAAARSAVDAAAAEAATSPANDRPEPTEAQKDAGNYKVGKITINGLPISIENPTGTSRRPEWPPLKNHYGYIRRTEGADGDHVDVFLGPGAENPDLPVFVIDQVHPTTRKFDEHKVILGAATGREARRIYQANYAPGWKGFGAITPMPLPQFKTWLQGDTSKPASPSVVAPPRKPSFSKPKPEPSQVDTPAFKRWFGDSKVVDADGKPLVVYHGTAANFAAFDPKKVGSNYGQDRRGFFFTPNPKHAGYAADDAAEKGGAAAILPVYLSIQSPLQLDAEISSKYPDAVSWFDNQNKSAIMGRATRGGHDGIIVRGGADDAVFIAFRPEQIKSATGNTGAFDPSNPDIRFSKPAAAPAGPLDEGAVRDIANAMQKDWGPAGPRVRVLASAEELPSAAKAAAGYKGTEEGYYDGQKIYLVASNLRSAERVQQVLAHEAVGHYGVDRIIDEHVEGGWEKLSGDIDRLRKDRSLGSKDMRAVLDDVERRYRVKNEDGTTSPADSDLFAKEVLGAMAEKDVRNGLISRAIAAIKAWLRKFIPGYNPTEKQLRGLLDKSHQLLRAGPNYAQRTAAVQGMSFSQKAPAFYSALVESARKAQGAPKSGTAAQWKGWLDGAQRRGEFKQSERDWMGVDQWLGEQSGGVTREQLAAFVNANAVTLGETTYAKPDTTWTQADQDRWAELTDTFMDLSADERAELDELNRRAVYGDQVEAGDPGVARYSSYTLPGGKGYRELMMTLPPTAGRADFDNRHHFPGMKNILVHVRFNERTDASGKRVLHVEEVQSDWHQHGRRFGYSSESIMDIDRLRAVEVRPGEWEVQDGRGDETDGRIYFERARAEGRAEEDNRALAENAGITPAPLRRTEDWALLGMKRAIRWAAENGFERVTWTTGQQQAERYDLRKRIDAINWRKNGETYDITVSKDGDVVEQQDGLTERQLVDAIGKEPTDKIIAQGKQSGRSRGQLSGLDLAVGGAGMKSFYDQMLPKAVAGYVKKWGAKVGTTTIETGQSELTKDGDLVPEKLTVHSLDLTPAMIDSAMRGQPLFSKPDASVDALDQVLAQPDGGAWQRAKEWIKGKWQDFQPTALGALALRHVLELAEPLLPGAKRYADLVQQIGADRNIMIEKAGGLSDRLQKWARGGRLFGGYTAEARALFDLIHKSTIDGSDPSKPYSPMHFEDSRGRPVAFSPEAVKERKKALQDQMRGRSGDDKAPMMEELKFLDRLPGIERARKDAYPGLVAAWQQLSPEAQRFYTELRDHYISHSNEVEKALVKRIDALDIPEQKKQALAAKIRYQFETQRLQGVYFPLQRFGEFWVSATDADGEHAYLMFENAKEWTRAQAKLKQSGFTITGAGRKDQNYRAKDAPSGTFVADIIRVLQESHVTEGVQDKVYQEFLKSLPELSMRKHGIHRKATAGFSDDAARAFAKNAFHGAHQLSRLRYAHELQSTLDAMRTLADEQRKGGGMPPEKVNAMDALLGEMARRHDWIMSPTDSKVANYASAIGFAYYLGVTPAAALVNLTQGALTTFPVLGAQHGFDKAGRMLSAATRDAMRTWGNIDRVLHSDEERAAFKALLERGDIQRTAAHNLAGIAEGSDLQANPVWAKTMHGISYVFQKMEEINRQAAGVAAFRMARAAGQDFNGAVKYASEIINRTHYDFSNANRARFMQSAPAKVLLMFRQYALNTSWLLGRATYKAFAGESPDVRREARRTLAGVLGMSALFSGAMGLPFMGIASTVANAIQAAFGDDDEPWDFNTEVRNFLAGMLGPEAARWVADGAVSRAGADVASRVSMSQMWFRDADRELEGQDAYYNLLEQAAGPMGGIVKNLLVGKKQIDDGHIWRGVETMLPKALKDSMKALRFADEGANTLRGDPLIEDVTAGEKFVQLLGFSPTRLAEQYRVNRTVKNYEQHILDRRASLLSALALATRLRDDEMRAAALQRIQAFNQKFPELALTQRSITQSLRARARYSAQAESGIVLNKKIAERAREAAGFAG
jgi:GGDEF domain-containing protein